MTEANPNPSPDPTLTPPANPGTDPAKPFHEGWAPELVTHKGISTAKSAEDVARMFVNAEKRLGVPLERHLVLPEKADDAEGYAKIYDALGRPKDPAGYGLTLPDGASDDMKARAGRFGDAAHKMGLTSTQAKTLMEFNAAEATEAAKAQEAARTAANEAATKALKEKWGGQYETKQGEVGRLLTKFGGEKLAQELLTKDVGSNPELLSFLGEMVDLLAESGKLPDITGSTQENRGLTPDQARAERATLQADPVKGKALMEPNNPLHKQVMDELRRLNAAIAAKAA